MSFTRTDGGATIAGLCMTCTFRESDLTFTDSYGVSHTIGRGKGFCTKGFQQLPTVKVNEGDVWVPDVETCPDYNAE